MVVLPKFICDALPKTDQFKSRITSLILLFDITAFINSFVYLRSYSFVFWGAFVSSFTLFPLAIFEMISVVRAN